MNDKEEKKVLITMMRELMEVMAGEEKSWKALKISKEERATKKSVMKKDVPTKRNGRPKMN